MNIEYKCVMNNFLNDALVRIYEDECNNLFLDDKKEQFLF